MRCALLIISILLVASVHAQSAHDMTTDWWRSSLVPFDAPASDHAQANRDLRPTWTQRGVLTVAGAAAGVGSYFVIEALVSGGPEGNGTAGNVALALSYPVFATAGMLVAGEVLGLEAPVLAVGTRVVLLAPVGLALGVVIVLGSALLLDEGAFDGRSFSPSLQTGVVVGVAIGSLLPTTVASGRFRASPVIVATPTGRGAPGLSLRLAL